MRLPLLVSIALGGCAGSAQEARLARVEDALRSVQTQQQRADDRLADLSNKLFVLNDKLQNRETLAAAVPAGRPELKVVKLVPASAKAPPAEQRSEPPADGPAVDVDLRGYDDPTRISVVPVAPPPRIAAPEGDVMFREALTAFREGKHDDAYARFQKLLAKHPEHPDADGAYYWMGETRFELKAYAQAASEYQKLLARYPKSDKAPDALMKLGVAYERLGEADKAHQSFRDLVEKFPRSALGELARARLTSAGGGK